jgi:hypothetical protein
MHTQIIAKLAAPLSTGFKGGVDQVLGAQL